MKWPNLDHTPSCGLDALPDALRNLLAFSLNTMAKGKGIYPTMARCAPTDRQVLIIPQIESADRVAMLVVYGVRHPADAYLLINEPPDEYVEIVRRTWEYLFFGYAHFVIDARSYQLIDPRHIEVGFSPVSEEELANVDIDCNVTLGDVDEALFFSDLQLARDEWAASLGGQLETTMFENPGARRDELEPPARF